VYRKSLWKNNYLIPSFKKLEDGKKWQLRQGIRSPKCRDFRNLLEILEPHLGNSDYT
jgi:hypothetical protein